MPLPFCTASDNMALACGGLASGDRNSGTPGLVDQRCIPRFDRGSIADKRLRHQAARFACLGHPLIMPNSERSTYTSRVAKIGISASRWPDFYPLEFMKIQLQELDVLADRIRRMRRALDLGLKCGCIRIEDRTLSLADVQGETGKRTRAGCDRRC
jgi:hypothetical protein